jgi:hypothetical protein
MSYYISIRGFRLTLPPSYSQDVPTSLVVSDDRLLWPLHLMQSILASTSVNEENVYSALAPFGVMAITAPAGNILSMNLSCL